jgi:hypothetical protein
MRHAILLSLLASCAYTPPADTQSVDSVLPSEPNDPGDPNDPVDPPPPPDGPAAPPQGTCSTSDSSLTLCLELEDQSTGIALDGSGQAHHAQVTGATPTERDVPAISRALSVNGSSTIMIGDTPDFDVQTLTISAWVKRSATPSFNQRYGIVDVGRKQAALALDDLGRVVCMVRTNFDVWVGTGFTATAIDEWSLVACTYDAPELCMYTFKNGSSNPDVECGNTDGEPLDMTVNAGGTIGALFDSSNQPTSKLAGSIDSIRVYGRPLSETRPGSSAVPRSSAVSPVTGVRRRRNAPRVMQQRFVDPALCSVSGSRRMRGCEASPVSWPSPRVCLPRRPAPTSRRRGRPRRTTSPPCRRSARSMSRRSSSCRRSASSSISRAKRSARSARSSTCSRRLAS